MTRAALIITLALLAGCTDFPALDTATSAEARAAPYPRLVPLEGLIAGAEVAALDAETGARLAARAAALRRRAAQLRRISALPPADRARLMRAIARHPG
ncbi:hypothetical protein [Actibacterium sp. MT2.3-13A]|uniref:hypothetical protein n=1 Tax=Actibacterium sp. MT2.3-13A TaxID=2828332 RepID=UPI002012EE14|nr:hypothetical protein [Actibacterium sp. MT2.3-13A]